jgi:hypothetical protein
MEGERTASWRFKNREFSEGMARQTGKMDVTQVTFRVSINSSDVKLDDMSY